MSAGPEAFEPWAWDRSAQVLAPVPRPLEASGLRGNPSWSLQQQELLAASLGESPLSPSSLELAQALMQPAQAPALQTLADDLRRTLVGETVTYVRNRNLNFTNHCVQHCSFCAFRRDAG
ncbi:MAG: hypothetical protein RLZZ32_1499, partial [Cyanobacteriota bacterium]